MLAATGKLEPLDRYVDAGLKSSLTPESTRDLAYQGKLVALPWTRAPARFWYDELVMQKAGLDPAKPPKTIDELMSDMAAIRKSLPDVIPLALDTTNRPFSLQSNWPWMATFDAAPLGGANVRADSLPMHANGAAARVTQTITSSVA